MRNKPKFDKSKCLKCKYHGRGKNGYSTRKGNTTVAVFCDFATITDTTCLKRNDKGTAKDLRGEDFDNCKLFSPGKAEREFSKFRV